MWYAIIEFTDDGKKMRYDFFHIVHGPLLKCFCENGVVGVCAGLAYNFNCFIHGEAFELEQTNKFRNHHGRMGVVDLDCNMLVEVVQIKALVLHLLQDQLCTAAYHEVLLIDTQLTACIIRVIRVEEEGEVPLDVLLIEVDRILSYHIVINRIEIEEMETVHCAGLISGNIDIVEYGIHCVLAEGDLEGYALALLQPALLVDPWVLHLMLEMILEFLLEEAVVIVEANSVTREI